MTDQSLSELGKSLARKEAEKAQTDDATKTVIGFEGTKADGVTVNVDQVHDGAKVDWSFGAWVKRKFQRGGSSAGVKGEIKF